MTLAEAYRLLGSSKEDTDNEVKKKYHKMVMQYHPDKHVGGNIEYATQKMQEINAAYERIIHSRSDSSEDFDWGISITVTYKRPPRPKGKTNPNANIARTTIGYHCDFWNLWNPKAECSSAFCGSLYRDIARKINQKKSKYDLLFFDPIVDRITYYGAAEYVDPYNALCERFETADISDAVNLLLITKGSVDIPEGSPVLLSYDQSLLVQPYAISFSTLDGRNIGTVRSMESICISLLKEHLGASITGTIESIMTRDEYDFSVRKRISTNYIKIRLHISIDRDPKTPFGFANNREQIHALFDLYGEYSCFINTLFTGIQFGIHDVDQIYHTLFTKVQRPEINESPIYTLSYRVYEGDSHEIDGNAQCDDLTKFNLLSPKEKELLCYIYAATRKYDHIKRVCNTKTSFYQCDGEKVRFIIRLYMQKNPNHESESDIKYWHNIRISIYPKLSCY